MHKKMWKMVEELVPIRKLSNIILGGAKNLCGRANHEILRPL